MGRFVKVDAVSSVRDNGGHEGALPPVGNANAPIHTRLHDICAAEVNHGEYGNVLGADLGQFLLR